MDLLLIVAGLVAAFISKNKRWLILSAIGVLWLVADVMLIALTVVSAR
jgi:hypothetical protein